MRTSIELTDDQRAALMALAAKRRLRGYSLIVQEAVARYLDLPVPPLAVDTLSGASAKRGRRLLKFLETEFRTGQTDSAEAHDEYIYRGRR